ncbi:MAG TPA: sn-glycerol-3-phosphate ABC transporter ATP-binding protein UgpC [Gaiellaceae bacterium]|jgi:multiple sugar transport system ATP-binding protein|nr:sn-glycerol-3-phosphate ABC transporter ATP-binding protein UgpC [Gaiellaceae bacterium]
MAGITLDRLTKVYGDGTKAVDAFDLAIEDGEFMVFVGPSGCGKTTALRMIAGLEAVTEGQITIGDQVVTELPPKRRDVAMVFQNYALYPHMSVFDNIAFGLKMRRTDKTELKRRVNEAARVLGLTTELRKKPGALSGGQRQRVAMGRAIVREPRVFLMDEPLSNLDAKLRIQMRAEIARIQRDLGVTTVYVTHDQSEAMTLGHRVCVMRGGLLQQAASPQDVYNRPANLFVAGFIGSPPMNLMRGSLERDGDALRVRLGETTLDVGAELLAARPALAGYAGREVAVGLRPEDVEDAAIATHAVPGARLRTTVDIREDMGAEVFLHVPAFAPPALTEDVREALEDAAAESEARHAFVARVDRTSSAAAGDAIELAVDTKRLHFFDLDTGDAIHGDPS